MEAQEVTKTHSDEHRYSLLLMASKKCRHFDTFGVFFTVQVVSLLPLMIQKNQMIC